MRLFSYILLGVVIGGIGATPTLAKHPSSINNCKIACEEQTLAYEKQILPYIVRQIKDLCPAYEDVTINSMEYIQKITHCNYITQILKIFDSTNSNREKCLAQCNGIHTTWLIKKSESKNAARRGEMPCITKKMDTEKTNQCAQLNCNIFKIDDLRYNACIDYNDRKCDQSAS